MENDTKKLGLSSENINFIVILITTILLLYGPIESYGLTIRIAYLIIIPAILWKVLKYFGHNLEMNEMSNNLLNRALAIIVAVILLISAYSSYTSKYHTECDQYTQTRDGHECVGNYITVKGSDKAGMSVKLIFAGIIIWYFVAKRPEKYL